MAHPLSFMENVLLNINIKEDLREEFKVWCIRRKTTMSDEITKFIEKRISE